ncbi:MAG: MGMT family protein, partial [Candidatus Dependentiae bacterium]|nr:MGMT family protein [Candidatus Dependentiae bacterium]
AMLLDDQSDSFNLQGTPLQLKIWHALREIPQGSTVNYQDLAIQIGHPKAWRAVANAVGKNPIAYLIPCHRVIRKDGTLGGYRWGIHKKQALLLSERALRKKTPKV